MMKRKWRIILGCVGLILASIFVALLWLAPPLLRSSNYTVSYVVDGLEFDDAEVFKPLGISSRYYVRFPSAKNRFYRWIGIDFERGVAAMAFLTEESFWGTPSIRRDQRVGLLLTNGKLGEDWQVSVTRDVVNLVSSRMSVMMERRTGE